MTMALELCEYRSADTASEPREAGAIGFETGLVDASALVRVPRIICLRPLPRIRLTVARAETGLNAGVEVVSVL